MKSERLMDLISEIDHELIESADIKPTKKKTAVSPVIISLLAAAACVAVIVSVGYVFLISRNNSKNKSFDNQGITWNEINSDNKNPASAEPEKKIDVKINMVDKYGCNLSLIVNNEEDYEKYYTYGDFVLHKQTEDGDVLLTPKPIDKTKIQTIVPATDDPKDEGEIIPYLAVSKEPVTLDQNETSVDIVWGYNYGDLEKGDYYITVDIYDSENGTIIQTEIPFTVE